MHTPNYNNQHETGPTTAATVTLHLNPTQQDTVNKSKRDVLAVKTRKKHNSNITLFISFIEECCATDPNFIRNGSVNDIVKMVDLSAVPDKEIYIQASRGEQYRQKTVVWNNVSRELVDLFLFDPRYMYKWEKGPNGIKQIKQTVDNKNTLLTFDTRRKYIDALKFGKKEDKGSWNSDLQHSLKDIITSLKVNAREAKSNGQVEETEADALPFTLFEYMCQYAIQAGNAFLWVMALLQWNCMSRSQNIDDLKFSNFSLNLDAIAVKFDKTKMDREGRKTTPKHCYANPFNFAICLFTALGIYFCVVNEKWDNDRVYIFINKGAAIGSAASNYCGFITKWAKEKKERIIQFVRADHVNAHGIRKGSATEATANTAEASIASIFHRGEWSLGVVLDIYWKFAQRGDQILGRILAGLCPDKPTFDVLPPHFTVDESNEHVKKAMDICFGNILRVEEGRTGEGRTFARGILLRCLASVVYHEQKIQQIFAKCPDHAWKSLPLFLNNDNLLRELKKLVTTEPTKGFCDKSTGAASNTKLIKSVHQILHAFDQYEKERVNMEETIKTLPAVVGDAVKKAMEEKALQNGHLTYDNVSTIIVDMEARFETKTQNLLNSAVDEMRRVVGGGLNQPPQRSHQTQQQPPPTGDTSPQPTVFQDYSHSGSVKRYHVPLLYTLPARATISAAFELWVNGHLTNKTSQNGQLILQPVRPYYLWTVDNIPHELWKKFNAGYSVLSRMMDAPSSAGLGLLVVQKGGQFTREEIKSYFDPALDYLLSRAEYVKSKKYESWAVTTWTKNLNYNAIMKYGTEADKAWLPEEGRYNKSHSGRTRRQKQAVESVEINFEELN